MGLPDKAVGGAQRGLQLAEEGFRIAEAAVPVTQKRVDAGKSPEVELLRINTAVAMARIELEQAKRDLQTARLNLATQWGEKRASFPSVIGNLEQVREPSPLESLNAKLRRNPNLARWTAEREKREAAIRQSGEPISRRSWCRSNPEVRRRSGGRRTALQDNIRYGGSNKFSPYQSGPTSPVQASKSLPSLQAILVLSVPDPKVLPLS